ncbi:MAG: hypothetical protein QNL77_02780 [Akkermansiaceae bacterium]
MTDTQISPDEETSPKPYFGYSARYWMIAGLIAVLFRFIILPWFSGPNLKFEILNDSSQAPFKANFEIVVELPKDRLPKKNELVEIFESLDPPKNCENIFVSFYLPGMELDTPFALVKKMGKDEIDTAIHTINLGFYPEYHRFADPEWIDPDFKTEGKTANFSD